MLYFPGFKATVLLGMHSLLLSILLTTLPVLTPRSFSLGEATAAAQALMYFQLLLSSQLWYKVSFRFLLLSLLLGPLSFTLTLTVLVTTIDAQWEGMGDVGSARYEPALLPHARP